MTAQPPAGFEGTAELRRVRLGDASGALRTLDEAEALDPGNGVRRTLRARALAELRRLPEAREAAQEALTLLRPDSPDADEAREVLDSIPPETSGAERAAGPR